MKKTITTLLLGGLSVALVGCGAGMGPASMQVPGLLWSETKVPAWDLTVNTSTDATSRTGTAMCRSILGLVATGDCSIEAAKRNGGITRVASTDFQVKNILAVYAEYTTIVTGQ